MTSFAELPPLPSPEQYHESAAELDRQFQRDGGIRYYLRTYVRLESSRSPSMKSFIETARIYGDIMEPVDRSTGRYHREDAPTARAVVEGSVAGLLLTKQVHKNMFGPQEILEELVISYPDDAADPLEQRQQMAVQFVDLGETGIAKIGEKSEDIFDTWESTLVSEVAHHRMFRRGLGMVALGANLLHEKHLEEARQEDIRSFESSLADIDRFDWDAAASSLFDGP